MRPMSDINVGDQYQKGYPSELIWYVSAIDKKENMVQLQAYSFSGGVPKEIMKPSWFKNTRDIFRNRIYNAKTCGME